MTRKRKPQTPRARELAARKRRAKASKPAAKARSRAIAAPAVHSYMPARRPDAAWNAKLEAARAAGHEISIQIEHVDAGKSYAAAKCACGWVSKRRRGIGIDDDIDGDVAAHWDAVLRRAGGRPTPTPGTLPYHPLADIFPLIEGKEFRDLVADIQAHGQREAVITFEGAILDGRNRYRACLAGGVAPRIEPYRGDDPIAFVCSANLRRRHLTTSQRALIAARLQRIAKAGRPASDDHRRITAARAAALMNVSQASVERAATVRDKGSAALQAAVAGGEVEVSTAADVASLDHARQVEVIARGADEILKAAKVIRAEKSTVRRAARIEKIKTAAAGDMTASGKRYPVIYADPPWRFEAGDSDRSVEEHYPTMTVEEVCALPVRALATDDAALFLWITVPLRNHDNGRSFTRVLDAWGFESVSEIVWDKEKIGLGFWTRGQHEILVIAKRGTMPAPAPDQVPVSVYRQARGAHSEKPANFYPMIEAIYPELPRIELFARQMRIGWDAWGNQVGGNGGRVEPHAEIAREARRKAAKAAKSKVAA